MRKLILFLLMALATSIASFAMSAHGADNNDAAATISDEKALECCKWYVSAPPPATVAELKKRQEVAQIIVKYIADTDKFDLELTESVMKLIDLNNPETGVDLFSVYLAGETVYCLENGLSKSDASSFASAMADVVHYYSQMKNHDMKPLNKYLKMDRAEQLKQFTKLYNQNSSH
ncbi:MAG: hypothetical protein K2K55_10795 [Duncaniella sp.]|nr:hypothetical protein [Duncaniella sp.]